MKCTGLLHQVAQLCKVKCDKSCKLQVKGLFCREQGPTLKLGSSVSVRRMLEPAGTSMQLPCAKLFLQYFYNRQDAVLPCVFSTEVHLLSLIRLFAMGYVYHQGTIYVAEVRAALWGKAYEGQMGYLNLRFLIFAYTV